MPKDIKKALRSYYIYAALYGTWFAAGVWLLFSRKYATDTETGIFDAIAFGIALLVEVPAGTIADRLGRRKTVIIGVILSGLGYGIWAASTSKYMMASSFLVYWIGGAIMSGSDEAMMFEYLKAKGHEHLWQRVSTDRFIITRASMILAVFAGGLLYNANVRLPFFARMATFALMLIPLAWLKVVDKYQPVHSGQSSFLHDLKVGIKEILLPEISWVLPIYLAVQGVGFATFTSGILRPILFGESGIKTSQISTYISLSILVSIIVMLVGSRRFKHYFFSKVCLYGMVALMCAGFLANLPNNILLAIGGLTCITLSAYSLRPILSNAINAAISSKFRATTLSAASFCESITYVVLGPTMGYLSAKGSIHHIVYLSSGLVAVGGVASLLLRLRIHRKKLAAALVAS